MELFHSSRYSSDHTATALKHFGSIMAAANRVEGTFSAQEKRIYDGSGFFSRMDNNGRPLGKEKLEASLKRFCAHASQYGIFQYEVKISHPLKLIDLWDDDPIASGGLDIVRESGLSPVQLKQMQRIFSPFTSAIYPDHVWDAFDASKLKLIVKKCMSNFLAKRELIKRKRRSAALGENWSLVIFHEAVWVHLTMQLRLWAIENNFDSFVYVNERESTQENSYVCLLDRQVTRPTGILKFDTEKYMSEVTPGFHKYLCGLDSPTSKKKINSKGEVTEVFWGGHYPLDFWK